MRKAVLVGLTVLCGATIMGAAALTGASPETAHRPVPQDEGRAGTADIVLVETLRAAADPASRSLVATLVPRVERIHSFEIGGRLEARLVDLGDRVHAGQVLARLDAADLRLLVVQTEAEVSAARMALATTQEAARRANRLNDVRIASDAAREVADAQFEEARARLEAANAARDLARRAIDDATLTATEDGLVLAVPAEPGEVVGAGQPILRIAPEGSVEARVSLPESFAGLPLGTEAQLELWSDPGRTILATLREVSPVAASGSGAYDARFHLAKFPDGAPRLGMTGRLILSAEAGPKHPHTRRLPIAAIYDAGQGPGVWELTEADRLRFVPVSIQRLEAGHAITTLPLPDGARIVALGANRLRAGQLVRPLSRPRSVPANGRFGDLLATAR